MLRKVLVGFAVVLAVVAGLYIRRRLRRPPPEIAYAGEGKVTLWNSTAQVRAPVGTVAYGDRVQVLRRFDDQAEVRTPSGAVGWTSAGQLLSAAFWKQARGLESSTADLPIEARGHTRVLSNLHLEPGRDAPRVRQLLKNVRLDLYERRVAEMPRLTPASSGGASEPGRSEDWWLVRAHLADQPPIAGWILGQFVDLDVPEPLPDYASSAGMRIVAWFELNRVADAQGVARPQYLVVGTHGAEGQPCDFSTVRVYTWSKRHARYETAFVQSDVCGKLPVKIARPPSSPPDLTFGFRDVAAAQNREYLMRQTIVRAVGPPRSVRAGAGAHSRR
ncbi:MAG TPA: SH3 domain-containing protein [Candidatus Acidoferrales bacterium]|nr:SH3 domain-containing protein [Candidatus Acidoferrales bacterium]